MKDRIFPDMETGAVIGIGRVQFQKKGPGRFAYIGLRKLGVYEPELPEPQKTARFDKYGILIGRGN